MIEITKEFVIANMRHWRTRLGLSQQQLADKADVGLRTISKLENWDESNLDDLKVSRETVEKIFKVLAPASKALFTDNLLKEKEAKLFYKEQNLNLKEEIAALKERVKGSHHSKEDIKKMFFDSLDKELYKEIDIAIIEMLIEKIVDMDDIHKSMIMEFIVNNDFTKVAESLLSNFGKTYIEKDEKLNKKIKND